MLGKQWSKQVCGQVGCSIPVEQWAPIHRATCMLCALLTPGSDPSAKTKMSQWTDWVHHMGNLFENTPLLKDTHQGMACLRLYSFCQKMILPQLLNI